MKYSVAQLKIIPEFTLSVHLLQVCQQFKFSSSLRIECISDRTWIAISMQQLLDICNNYGVANDITFNPLKAVCLVFRPAKYNLFCPRVHIGSAQIEYLMYILQSILVLCIVKIKRMTVIC